MKVRESQQEGNSWQERRKAASAKIEEEPEKKKKKKLSSITLKTLLSAQENGVCVCVCVRFCVSTSLRSACCTGRSSS